MEHDLPKGSEFRVARYESLLREAVRRDRLQTLLEEKRRRRQRFEELGLRVVGPESRESLRFEPNEGGS